MRENYKPVGDYIKIVNQRNSDLSISNLIGLSIDKCYITSVANVIGTDLRNYKIIKKGQFACSLMQVSRDGKIPVACMNEYDEAIMSPAYVIFEIIDKNVILPEYLNMWFMRSEFDREASFLAVGGVRGSLAWDDFCRMEIPLVTLEKQKKLVNAYQAIENRINLKQKINDNLEAQAEALFTLQVQYPCEMHSLGSFGTVITGKTPSTEVPEFYGNDMPFVKTPDMHGNVYITTSTSSLSTLGAESQANKYLPENTVVVACIGANAGEVAITSFRTQTNQQINAIISDYPCFLYFSVKAHKTELRALGEGSSTMININKTSFENYEIPSPKNDQLLLLEKQLGQIFGFIRSNIQEIDKLKKTQDILLTQLSH